jgi:virulence-associated protein VapD
LLAITYTLSEPAAARLHPDGLARAHTDIDSTLRRHDFRLVNTSFYVTDSDDMATLFLAILALKALPWFPASVRDIRGFRVDLWSDLTPIVKGT